VGPVTQAGLLPLPEQVNSDALALVPGHTLFVSLSPSPVYTWAFCARQSAEGHRAQGAGVHPTVPGCPPPRVVRGLPGWRSLLESVYPPALAHAALSA